MANIGDVTATLKADIGQYVGPMQQAADATKQVQVAVDNATQSLVQEGAAGQAAGKGLSSFGAATADLAKQLATAEGRLTQMQAAFTSLGIPATGKEFARVTAEVERLRAELARVAPEAAKAAQATSQVVPAVAKLQGGTTAAQKGLVAMRGSLANLASSAAGIPGPLGNIASKFLMFGVGGPVTVGVLAGLAAISFAWSKWRETVEKETARATAIWERTQSRMRGRDAFIDVVEEREEALKRLTAANERLAMLQAQEARGGVTGAFRGAFNESLAVAKQEADAAARALANVRAEMQAIARDRVAAQDALAMAGVRQEVPRAQLELVQANRALRDINREVAASAGATVEQLQAQAAAADRVRTASEQLEAALKRTFRIDDQTREAKAQLDKVVDSLRQVKAEEAAIAARALEIRTEESQKRLDMLNETAERLKQTLRETEQALLEKSIGGAKGDDSVKQSVEAAGQEAVESMREVANTLASAFMEAFSDNEKTLMERIAGVLRRAIQAAVEKVIAQKLFDELIRAMRPDKGLADGVVGGIVDAINPFKSGMPMPEAPSFTRPAPESFGGATIIVPLDGLPAPLGPIEQARDAMHQALWIETARQAQLNGVNLSPRYR